MRIANITIPASIGKQIQAARENYKISFSKRNNDFDFNSEKYQKDFFAQDSFEKEDDSKTDNDEQTEETFEIEEYFDEDEIDDDVETYENLASCEKSGKQRKIWFLAAYENFSKKIERATGEKQIDLLAQRAEKSVKYAINERNPKGKNFWFKRAFRDLIRAYNSSTEENQVRPILDIINACLFFENNSADEYKETWRDSLYSAFDVYVGMFKGSEKEFVLVDKINQCERILGESDEKEKWSDRLYISNIELSECTESKDFRASTLQNQLLFASTCAQDAEFISTKEKWQERTYDCYSKLADSLPIEEQLNLAEQFHILCCSYIEDSMTNEQKQLWTQRREDSQKEIISLLEKLKK